MLPAAGAGWPGHLRLATELTGSELCLDVSQFSQDTMQQVSVAQGLKTVHLSLPVDTDLCSHLQLTISVENSTDQTTTLTWTLMQYLPVGVKRWPS